MSEWRPIPGEKPPMNEEVLIHWSKQWGFTGSIRVGSLSGGDEHFPEEEWYECTSQDSARPVMEDPTHWMPIPAPPEVAET